jgi:hypothetical protein
MACCDDFGNQRLEFAKPNLASNGFVVQSDKDAQPVACQVANLGHVHQNALTAVIIDESK